MNYYIYILVAVFTFNAIYAQELQPGDTSSNSQEIQWENILDISTQDEDNQSVFEEVTQLEDNPVDLNTSSVEELRKIPMITNLIAMRIVSQRNTKLFVSVNELLNIEGITAEMLSFIKKFIKIETNQQGAISRGYFISKTSSEIEKRRGFINNEYLGSSIKVLNKFQLIINKIGEPFIKILDKIELGMLAEKDAGERNLFNHLTGYGCLFLTPISTRLIIGDYRVESAEGLVYGRMSAFSKGGEIIGSTHRNGSGIRPNRSSDENIFMRGFAAEAKMKYIQFQIMYSNKLINATIDTLGQILGFDRSGLFRTENELKRKNSTRERKIGYRALAYITNSIKIGATGYIARFDNPLTLDGENIQTTKQLHMHGIDVSYTDKRIDIYSEYAQDRSNKVAMIYGITYEPISTLAMTIMSRKYPPSFQSIYGNAFGESNGQIKNEEGLYAGIRFRPFNWLWISSYYDQFKYFQFAQSVMMPSNGNDYFLLANSKLSNKFEFAIRYKRKQTPLASKQTDLFGREIKRNIHRIQQNFRLIGEYASSPSLQLVSRVEWTSIDYDIIQKAEDGVILSQSAKWNFYGSLTFQGRISMYGTDSYDSRIYEFENDFPHYLSSVVLFGRGIYWCLVSKCQLSRQAVLAVKYSQIIKEGVNSLGTGLDEIKGDTQSVISIQIDVQF